MGLCRETRRHPPRSPLRPERANLSVLLRRARQKRGLRLQAARFRLLGAGAEVFERHDLSLAPVIENPVMKTTTVADLRNNFRRVSAWIENGETVEIVKRGRPFARLVPPVPENPAPNVHWQAQAREIWRGRVFSADKVKAMEDFEHEGEEG